MAGLLFVCVGNSGRSQMAEAFAKRMGAAAASAGTVPEKTLNPAVVEAMAEIGVDISANRPRLLTSKLIDEADLVVTMGCSIEEACPGPMLARVQKKQVDWSLEDPRGRTTVEVRQIRDEVERRVRDLIGCKLRS